MEQVYGGGNWYRHSRVMKVILAVGVLIVLLTPTEGHTHPPDPYIQPTPTSEAARWPRTPMPTAEPTTTSDTTRTPRRPRPTVQPTTQSTATVGSEKPASDIFPQGEWEYTGNGGQDWMTISLVQMPNDEAMERLEEYDPMDMAVEDGINYIGENPNSWLDCREFAYGDAISPIFVALCVNDDMTLFVVGTDDSEVSWVAFCFSNGDPNMIPPDYYLQQ